MGQETRGRVKGELRPPPARFPHRTGARAQATTVTVLSGGSYRITHTPYLTVLSNTSDYTDGGCLKAFAGVMGNGKKGIARTVIADPRQNNQ